MWTRNDKIVENRTALNGLNLILSLWIYWKERYTVLSILFKCDWISLLNTLGNYYLKEMKLIYV